MENVFSIHEEIRHAVTRFRMIRFIVFMPAERALAIRDPELRNQREEYFSDWLESRGESRQRWKDRRPNQAQQPLFACRKLENTIGRFQKSLGVCESLVIVRLENARAGHAFDDER